MWSLHKQRCVMLFQSTCSILTRVSGRNMMTVMNIYIYIQCSPANPAQAGEEAVGLAGLSGLPSRFCVLVGE